MGARRLLHASNFLFGSRLLRPGGLSAGFQSRTRLVSVVDLIGDNFIFLSRRNLWGVDREVHCEARRANHGAWWSDSRNHRTFLDALCRAEMATLCRLWLLCTRLVGIRHGASHDSCDAMVSCATSKCAGNCLNWFINGWNRRNTIY